MCEAKYWIIDLYVHIRKRSRGIFESGEQLDRVGPQVVEIFCGVKKLVSKARWSSSLLTLARQRKNYFFISEDCRRFEISRMHVESEKMGCSSPTWSPILDGRVKKTAKDFWFTIYFLFLTTSSLFLLFPWKSFYSSRPLLIHLPFLLLDISLDSTDD